MVTIYGSIIRRIIPNDGGLDLQHLRRFVRYGDLPHHVRTSISASKSLVIANAENDASEELFLMVGSIECVSEETLIEELSSICSPVSVWLIQVPLLAPTSHEQAARWTSQYWPTVYKKSNPFGPHPSIVSRAEEEINKDIEKWMALATETAREARITNTGEEIGVVIVSRRNGTARPVAIAGDARWLDWHHSSLGNVTAHATLRAIAMVAEGLRDTEEGKEGSANAIISADTDIFRDHACRPTEQCRQSVDGDGYLCHGLEIYCTHEPCVMCSMAIVHSRFARVVFRRRMPHTGGLCADGELGHGLFWRKELNWTLLAWNWSSAEDYIASHEVESGLLHA
jgi:tRNA-specific adenosine deaminase 3